MKVYMTLAVVARGLSVAAAGLSGALPKGTALPPPPAR